MSAPTTAGLPAPALSSVLGRSRSLVVLGVAGAVVAAAAGALVGPVVGLAIAGLLLVAGTAAHPVAAVYIYLVGLPFLAGIDRDRLFPLVRANEALLVVVVTGALIGGYWRVARGDRITLRMGPLDPPLAVFAVLSTLWPVVWLLLRGNVPTGGELAAVLPVVKLVVLLVLVRLTVRTDDQLLRLARVIMWPAAGVAVIAVLQTLHVMPVLTLLSTYWSDGGSPADLAARGTTTLDSSLATGDYVVLAAALLIALAVRGLLGRRERVVLGLALGAGAFAAGQFSTWVCAIVVGTTMVIQYPQLRRAARRLLPAIAVVGLVGSPALLTRLAEFGSDFGLPRSWLGRQDNLVSFYLPALDDFRYVLGVSPNSVLQAPETWREVIYLESGYLHLLWVGGLPLLAAFGWLSFAVLRHARTRADRPDPDGAYAATLITAWWLLMILSLIDIHLIVRGVGELFFTFIAIAGRRTDGR